MKPAKSSENKVPELQELCRQRVAMTQVQEAVAQQKETSRLAKAQELYKLCQPLCKEDSCETKAIINGEKTYIEIITAISTDGTIRMSLRMGDAIVRLHITEKGIVEHATFQEAPCPLSIQKAGELIDAITPRASSSDTLQHTEGSTSQIFVAPSP